MYRFPLQLLTPAGDRYEDGEPVEGTAAVIGDSRGRPVMSLALGGTAKDDNARAAFVCDALNSPMSYALRDCLARAAIAKAGDRDKSAEFWHRLAGNLRKACSMV